MPRLAVGAGLDQGRPMHATYRFSQGENAPLVNASFWEGNTYRRPPFYCPFGDRLVPALILERFFDRFLLSSGSFFVHFCGARKSDSKSISSNRFLSLAGRPAASSNDKSAILKKIASYIPIKHLVFFMQIANTIHDFGLAFLYKSHKWSANFPERSDLVFLHPSTCPHKVPNLIINYPAFETTYYSYY